MFHLLAILVSLLIAAAGFTLFAFTSGLAAVGWFILGVFGALMFIVCLLPLSGG